MRRILFFVLIVLCVWLVSAATVTLIFPQAAESEQFERNFESRANISSPSQVREVIWNWNGSNFSLYNPNLILMFGFDNNSLIGENNTYFVDVSAVGRSANCPGCLVSSGRYGNGSLFESDSATLSTGIDPGTGDLSVFGWVKFEDNIGAKTLIGDWSGSGRGWAFWAKDSISAGPAVRLQASNGAYKYYSSSEATGDGEWHYVGFTWDNSADLLLLYKDGVQISVTKNNDQSLIGTRLGSVVSTIVGARPDTTNRDFFNGTIDELLVFNSFLSPEDAWFLYSSNLKKYDGTVWEFYTNQSASGQELALGTYDYELFVEDGSWSSGGKNNVTILSSTPEVLNVSLDDFSENVLLIPGGRKEVNCVARVREPNGQDSISAVEGVFYSMLVNEDSVDDNNNHYTNSSCSVDFDFGSWQGFADDENQFLVNCSFQVEYYAEPGSWSCLINVSDVTGLSGNGTDDINILEMIAMNLPDSVDFGIVDAESVSDEREIVVGNKGNVEIDVKISGFAQDIGDGLAMNCSGGEIAVEFEGYNLSESNFGEMSFSEFQGRYKSVSSVEVLENLNLGQRQDDFIDFAERTTYWRVYVPKGAGGTCGGSVVFSAQRS